MFNQETIQTILGIKEEVHTVPEKMAKSMKVTFFPYKKEKLSQEILNFARKLESTLLELGTEIIPYDKAFRKIRIVALGKIFVRLIVNNFLYLVRKLFNLPQKGHYLQLSVLPYLFKREKVKKGVSIIVLGENETKDLPMQYIYSFKDNSVLTILDFPKNINEKSTFHEHFDTALDLFSYHMTNLVIAVTKDKWLLYNFNASHPIFDINTDFKNNILKALVPKIVAPIRPYKLSEFTILDENFDSGDAEHMQATKDLVKGAKMFDKTSLYPQGKKIDDLKFRNNFYRWIGKLHLDNRNGMSYGFLTVQLPGKVSKLIPEKEFLNAVEKEVKGFSCFHNKNLYIKVSLKEENFWLQVPEVWVLSQKSGSDKTHINPEKDLLKLGLHNGKMLIQKHINSVIDNDYKTSFDTQVILAHAVGNAIIASILNHIDPDSDFLKRYKEKGVSISHWHGYIHPDHIQKGWHLHGITNPHVACSSPQSAIYALQGKLDSFFEAIKKNEEYKGDVHVEPHHGTNICYTSVSDLAEYLLKNSQASVLGNSYYYLYNK